jgi:hypothetical protein
MFRNPSLAPAINALYSDCADRMADSAELVDGQPVIDRYDMLTYSSYRLDKGTS